MEYWECFYWFFCHCFLWRSHSFSSATRGLPGSIWESSWSASRSSLEDEVAKQIAASSACDAADSPCQVLLFVSHERPFVNRITIFYNVTPPAGVPVLSNVCDQFRTSEALVRLATEHNRSRCKCQAGADTGKWISKIVGSCLKQDAFQRKGPGCCGPRCCWLYCSSCW